MAGEQMKIVFFRHSLLNRGGDKMIVAHANHLVSAGHDVCITAALFDTLFALDQRITCGKLPSKNKLSTIVSALKTNFDANLIIADIIPMACFLSLRNDKKVIYYAQDYDESYYTSSFFKGLVRYFYYIGLRLFGTPAIAVSHPLAELLRKKFQANVLVAENGIDPAVFYKDIDTYLTELKGNRRAFLILSRSDPRKGFDIARDVMERLSESLSDKFEVWTVGEPCVGIFPRLVHRDFGYIGEERLRQIMSSSDLFFYPTRHEGFPLMPLEAIACGCPVVTTTAVPYGSSESAIRMTDIADVASMSRLLSDLITNESLFAEFRHQASDTIVRYNLATCESKFVRHLVDICGEADANRN